MKTYTAVLIGGPRDGQRTPIMGKPDELTFGTHVYRVRASSERIGFFNYSYIGERGKVVTGDFDETGEAL